MMTGRERFLAAMSGQKANRLPCQVHSWMDYYLKTYLKGMDQFEAYDFFGMDPVIYANPDYHYSDRTLANWQEKRIEQPVDADGNHRWTATATTPEGDIHYAGAYNAYTSWFTEPIISDERDLELWTKYVPVPDRVDWTPVLEAKRRIGERGIVRGPYFDFGQGSPWQSYCYLRETEKAIYSCFDEPELIHATLESMLQKKLSVIERGGPIAYDLVETGGGAGSSTVISPDLHREFCLPYDIRQHAALHANGTRVVHHLCGGMMPLLEIVAENGADGLETMTPPVMGADCNLREASRRVGDKLFFIGGFDQNAGFEQGNPALVRRMVRDLFDSCPQGGYICSPSDHFFFGDPENIRAFARACEECVY
jgi:uroporphyrinogen-III decarboxylase